MTTYISIGNSDDKLSQKDWAWFWQATDSEIRDAGIRVHGAWLSPASSPWQNAVWCVDLQPEQREPLRDGLAVLAVRFRQDSIAWADAPVTEFIGEEIPDRTI